MAVTTSKTVKQKPIAKKPKANPQNPYRSIKDSEVRLSADEKLKAELLSKAIA